MGPCIGRREVSSSRVRRVLGVRAVFSAPRRDVMSSSWCGGAKQFVASWTGTGAQLREEISLLLNEQFSLGTARIHREDSAIRELQRNKEINIQYINTAYNLADFFTKILPMTTFRNFRDSIVGL